MIEILLVIVWYLAVHPEFTVPLFITILLFLVLPIIPWPKDDA